jgi:hypothetical protein
MVGENRFTSVRFGSGDPVRESPPSSDRISVRPGDVLGYFVIDAGRPDQDNGIELDTSFSNDRVFYANIDNTALPMGTCVSVGTGGVLSLSVRAAPVFSASVSK